MTAGTWVQINAMHLVRQFENLVLQSNLREDYIQQQMVKYAETK
jgi:hypothetical protein